MKLNLQKENGQRGITLITLVITIIVLLILAGVAINMAIDSNGLFGKANDAVEAWNTAVENERSEIQGLLDKIEIDPPGVVAVEGIAFDKSAITISIGKKEQLIPIIEPNEATNTNVTWTSSDDTKVTVNEDGIATGISEGTATITVTTESKNKTATCTVTVINPVATYVEETSIIAGVNKKRKAPIPVGFTASQIGGTTPENTIAGGLVIYQIPEDATVNWANNQITIQGETKNLQENTNQYVWIPVDDINNMVMCKKNGQTGTNGKKLCELELQNNELVCNTHGYTTATKLTKNNIDTTGLAGRLYFKSNATLKETIDDKKILQNYLDFTPKDTQVFSQTTKYREPEILTDTTEGDGVDSFLTEIGISVSNNTLDGTTLQDVFKEQLNDDFIKMAKSVAKYGGFFISRYEIGEDCVSMKNQRVLTAAKSGSSTNWTSGNKWYRII